MKTKLLFTLSLIFTMLCCSSSLSAQWIQMGQDIDGEAASDWSGSSVSLSSDGNTAAIGARYNSWNNSGHV